MRPEYIVPSGQVFFNIDFSAGGCSLPPRGDQPDKKKLYIAGLASPCTAGKIIVSKRESWIIY